MAKLAASTIERYIKRLEAGIWAVKIAELDTEAIANFCSCPYETAIQIRTILVEQRGWRFKPDEPNVLLVPPKPTSSRNPKSSTKRVDPKRLRAKLDQALEKALDDYISGEATASELTAAIRGMPIEPPVVDTIAPPVLAPTKDEAILMCRALLNTFNLDITITERG